MVLLIKLPVTAALKFGSIPGRDRCLPVPPINITQKFRTIVPKVCHNLTSIDIDLLQHRNCKIDVIALPFTQHKIYEIPIGVYNCMDFGACSLAAVSDFVCRPPFFAPALCWWAWTIEASRNNSSSSASRQSTRKMLSRIPSSIHLRNRLYTVFQKP